MFVSGEGALLGIGFVMRNVLLWFVPMGKMHQESYQQYRERKIGRTKKSGNGCILVTGLVFLLIGVIFTIIWYTNTY
jgi:Trk-type K+ transport system membrane component